MTKKYCYGYEGGNELKSYSNPKSYSQLLTFRFLHVCETDSNCAMAVADIFQYGNTFDDMCMHSYIKLSFIIKSWSTVYT